MERWRAVKDYPNYMVSDLGKVKNINSNRILKPGIPNRYLSVTLCNSYRRKVWTIHQLVAIAFLGFVPDGTQKIIVDHINNDPLDNRSENLQLITQRQNVIKSINRNLPTGVSKMLSGRYRARIGIGNKKHNLGSFDTLEAASAAYQEALLNL